MTVFGWQTHEQWNEPMPRMYEDDAESSLKLATVLKVILARSVRETDLPATQELLHDYLRVYVKVRLVLSYCRL